MSTTTITATTTTVSRRRPSDELLFCDEILEVEGQWMDGPDHNDLLRQFMEQQENPRNSPSPKPRPGPSLATLYEADETDDDDNSIDEQPIVVASDDDVSWADYTDDFEASFNSDISELLSRTTSSSSMRSRVSSLRESEPSPPVQITIRPWIRPENTVECTRGDIVVLDQFVLDSLPEDDDGHADLFNLAHVWESYNQFVHPGQLTSEWHLLITHSAAKAGLCSLEYRRKKMRSAGPFWRYWMHIIALPGKVVVGKETYSRDAIAKFVDKVERLAEASYDTDRYGYRYPYEDQHSNQSGITLPVIQFIAGLKWRVARFHPNKDTVVLHSCACDEGMIELTDVLSQDKVKVPKLPPDLFTILVPKSVVRVVLTLTQ